MARATEHREAETVHQVAPLNVPEADGGWPCAFCGDLFPVSDSWRVTLARSGTVIACESCAQEARRRRRRSGTSGDRSPHRRTGDPRTDRSDADG